MKTIELKFMKPAGILLNNEDEMTDMEEEGDELEEDDDEVIETLPDNEDEEELDETERGE